MTDALPFEPHRFRTAAAYYLGGRPPYAKLLITRVADRLALGAGDRMLDLGCGPGQLSRLFSPIVGEVVGLDPEPEMLRVAERNSAGFKNIVFRRGSSYDLSPALGKFRMVAMGRSFHWMDRVDTLRRLDAMIEPDGAVVLFSDKHPDVPANAWLAPRRAVMDRYARDDSAHARQKSPAWLSHEAILLDSAFAKLESIGITEQREISADTLIERSLSMTSTSPDRLGDRVDAMLAELRAVLPAGGMVREVITSTALIATRP
jgi:SAM-dependent methyltransferase